MRVKHHASDTVVSEAKAMARDLATQVKVAFEAKVNSQPGGVSTLEACIQPVLDALDSVSTAKSEVAARKLPVVQPVLRLLGKREVTHTLFDGRTHKETMCDYCVDAPFEQGLENWLKASPTPTPTMSPMHPHSPTPLAIQARMRPSPRQSSDS